MGRIRQTISYWCFDRKELPFMKLCGEAKRIGYEGLEMVPEDHWPVAKHFGMHLVTMTGHQSITEGLNRVEHHPRIEAEIKANLEKAAANGIQALICFSGNRAGLSDADGLRHTVAVLKRLAGMAEAANITLVLEL